MFAGAFFGFKQQLKEPPVRTNEIPRQIPLQAWYMSAPFTMLIDYDADLMSRSRARKPDYKGRTHRFATSTIERVASDPSNAAFIAS